MKGFDKFEDPHRRLIIKGLAAGTLFGALPATNALADAVSGVPPSRLPAGQSIYRLKGSVAVNGKEANLSTIIHANDTVETGKNSEIVFAVGGNAMILRSE
ncbi:MAG: hypothetical protein ACXWIN_02900, partial [Burkholderiaceae bacterium]